MTSPSQSSPPQYEVVPSGDLPLLDLSRSVGGELGGLYHRLTCRTSRVNPQWDADTVETSTRGRAIMAAYEIGHLLGAIVCFVPQSTGVSLAIAALMLTLPGSYYSLWQLRFDVAKLLVQSYDFWFYTSVNTTAVILLSRGFGDARACIAIIVWLGNLHTSFVDANTKLACFLVQGSVVTIALDSVVVLTISLGSIAGWRGRVVYFRVQDSSHTIGCDSLITNGLVTMIVLLGRNVLRRHWELRQQKKINCPMLRCLNLRYRVAFKPRDKDSTEKLQEKEAWAEKNYLVPAHQVAKSAEVEFPLTMMHYVRCPALFDATQTFYPVTLSPLHWRSWERLAFACIGVCGLVITVAALAVYPSASAKPIAVSGLSCTMLFVGLCTGLLHRGVFRAIVTSFDFLFLSFQLSFGLWCASMLFHWDVRSVAVASMWLWLHWVLTIDSLLPLMKEKIGFNTKLLVVPVLLLFIAAELAIMLEIVWLNRWNLEDQELLTLSSTAKIRLMPFFVSRATLSFLWALRLLCRVLTSRDNDDVVVMLGRVGYLYRLADSHRRIGGRDARKFMACPTTPHAAAGTTQPASRGQVAPLPVVESIVPNSR